MRVARMLHSLWGVVSCVVLLAGVAQGNDIHVPAGAPTIQAAIDAAVDGDRVLVSAGTYSEVLDLLGKSIEIIGVDGAVHTVVDASGAPGSAGVTIVGLAFATRLVGLTIRGADAQGVCVDDTSTVLIERCIIEGSGGRGIEVCSGQGGDVTVQECLVRNNAGGGAAIPAGFSLSAGLTLVRCRVENNGGPDVAEGGGCLRCVVTDCWVAGNEAVSGGGARNSPTSGSVYANNVAKVGGGYSGSSGHGGVSVADSVFLGNTAFAIGGGASLSSQSDSIFGGTNWCTGCVFVGNVAPSGSGLWSSSLSVVTGFGSTDVERCTFVDDEVMVVERIDLRGSIVRGGRGLITASTSFITYSNVEGGAVGTGNIDADPLFVDAANGVVCLSPGSPCIDVGPPNTFDPDGSPSDLGAVPFTSFYAAGAPTFGALGFPRLTGSGDLAAGSPITLSVAQAPPAASMTMVLGAESLFASFKGGTLVPDPLFLVPGLPTDGNGNATLVGTWPTGIPAGFVTWIQMWAEDAKSLTGFTATGGLALIAP